VFEYRVDLASIEAGPGQEVRLWVPAPVNGPAQRVQQLQVDAPVPHQIARDANGNRIVHLTWPGAVAGELWVRSLVRRAPSGAVSPEDAHPGTPLDPARYSAAASRIPLDGVIEALGEQESRETAGSAEKVRSFYAYVTANMKYSKHGDGWGQGDASEAWKSQRIDDYYGALPSDRIRFSVGRDLVLSPPQAGEPLNYFIYPYAEVDGVAVEKVPARFNFRRLPGPTVSH